MTRRRWPWVLGCLFLALMSVAAIGFVYLQGRLRPAGPAGPLVEVTIEAGMSTSQIAQRLQAEGVISSADFFTRYARFKKADGIEAGRYTFRRDEDLPRILAVLQGGATPDVGQRLTVPEGLTIPQVAEVVGRLPGRSAARFLEVAASGTVRSRFGPPGSTNLEGLLLPETYSVSPDETEADILRRLVEAFDDVATRADLTGGAARLGISPYQAVIVASMVEREARVDQDRGPIARVIYNRLARRMPLQIDATVQYALGTQKPRLLYSDLEVASPYNTYKVAGLPPGPIAAPGRPALDAALNPPPAPWIYYVLADANGSHAFAVTSADFERLKAEAMRKGLL